MESYESIANALARFFAAVDERDWVGVRASMTERVHVDYASFGGGEPSDVAPATVVEQWRQLLPGFDQTHHQLGNLHIDARGDAASVSAYVTATHTIGSRSWTVLGRYEVELVRAAPTWQVSSLRFHFKAQLGDIQLPEDAARRVRT